MARLLKPYGIQSKAYRPANGSVHKGYRLEDFTEAWRRYLTDDAEA